MGVCLPTHYAARRIPHPPLQLGGTADGVRCICGPLFRSWGGRDGLSMDPIIDGAQLVGFISESLYDGTRKQSGQTWHLTTSIQVTRYTSRAAMRRAGAAFGETHL